MNQKQLEATYDSLMKTFEEMYDEVEEDIFIEGKRIKDALKEQLELQVQWELFVSKVKSLRHYVELLKEETYAESISQFINHNHRSYSISEAREMAKAGSDYSEAREFAIKVYELHDEASGILETIHSRKYILNNMTNLTVASSENIIL